MKKNYKKYKSFNFVICDLNGEVLAECTSKSDLARTLGKSIHAVHENISKGYGFNWNGRRVKVHLVYNGKR